MKNWKLIALIVAGAGAVVAVLMFSNSKSTIDSPETPKKEKPAAQTVRKATTRAERVKSMQVRRNEAAQGKAAKKKPTFSLDDDDEAKLNDEQRKTIEAIRAALDAEDRSRVLKLVQKLQKSDEWPDGIPKSIKMAAIEALGWFGSSCLPELAGFLADRDNDVVQSAIEKYEEALMDPDLPEQDRSNILIMASKVVNDSDAMDSMLFELNNLSPSLAVETIKTLMVEGNAVTKALLPETIEFVTGEEGLTTSDKLDAWLKANHDADDTEANDGDASEKK